MAVQEAARADTGDARADGRTLRRERNRDLVVEALLDLLTDGLRPTAQEIAARSGVSLRSIFRIFEDLDTLHAEAAARQHERIRHLFVDVAASGPLDDRIDAVVDVNARIYEHIAPVRRAGAAAAVGSAPLREHLARSRAWFRDEVRRVFAAEQPDADTLAALEAALSWDAWDQLRSAQGLSAARAGRAVTRTTAHLSARRRPNGDHTHPRADHRVPRPRPRGRDRDAQPAQVQGQGRRGWCRRHRRR
jgi:AcrR family transcriptional regulator